MTLTQTVVRQRIVVRGIVQGVGFRPHLARLAADLGLAGSCHNDATCVVAEVEGPALAVTAFAERLVAEAPPLARIASVEAEAVAPRGETAFTIVSSEPGAGARTMVPPDAATCDACLAELHDPADRRYRHPFITCTHCGPRFTITLDLPYDRPVTTMAGFPMCEDCAREYADPLDRRYHAQPISCHACGPTLHFAESRVVAARVSGCGAPSPALWPSESAIVAAREALRHGRILAVKGIGGYHLVCDATDPDAVRRLRDRKHRPDQPFAVMVADLAAARAIVEVPEAAEPVLAGVERPIVLLPARPGAVVAEVAPGLDELGVMLPYTPLHHLLLEEMPPLVVTSGNRSGEPLAYLDDDALDRLADIADAFLTHDRPIAVPCDDSVIAWSAQGPIPIRRSRGFAPLPVPIQVHKAGLAAPQPETRAATTRDSGVLAAGSELKSTFALVREGQAFLSGHLGDLEDLGAQAAYATATDQLLRFHRAAPELVVADLHPGYHSHAWAERFADQLGVPLHLVQHHHAHLASLAAEHGRLDDDLVGLVLDGTGYGCSAQGEPSIWGGELLQLTDGGTRATRLGHLAQLPLPAGDQGVRNPVRLAAAALARLGLDPAGTPLASALTDAERVLYASDRDWPLTSSAGRLFDVVSALLGVRPRISYEAQAAVELEALARRQLLAHGPAEPLPAAWLAPGAAEPEPGPAGPTAGPLVLDHRPWLIALHERVSAGEGSGALAWAFHDALATGLASLALATGASAVGLTGGVFANRLLLALLTERLGQQGVEVLTHHVVPPGDGGLSLGQAAIGLRLLERKGS